MKRLLLLFLLALPAAAAVPSYSDFDTSWFGTNSGKITVVGAPSFGDFDADQFGTNNSKIAFKGLSTNLALTVSQWIDIPMNYSFSVTGPSAPALTEVSNNSAIKLLAFDNSDILYAQGQLQHNISTTNALNPIQYIVPHVHFSTVGTLDATHSNVTWRVEWELASIDSTYKRGTNTATVGVGQNYTHYMADLGDITNDPPMSISAVFRCRLMRPASGVRDYSNAHDVLLDGFDLHIPVGNVHAIGSTYDSAP